MRTIWRQLFAGDDSAAGVEAVLAPLRRQLAWMSDARTQARSGQAQLARRLLALQLPAWQVCELISDHNDLLYRQAVEAALAAMREQGWGEPPVAFCVLVMGSGGRHESLLHPDQDNALILDDYPVARHGEIDRWFLELAERFTAHLDQAGIPFCRGEVMASRPLWRKPIGEWEQQLQLWMAQRRVKLVQQCNILFDFAPVYGERRLARRLRAAIFARVPEAGLFLHEMGELFDEAPVALDRFDRLHGDGREAPHPEAINLKRQGLLPLTAALRLLALKRGSRAVGSRARMADLHRRGALSADQAWRLRQAFEQLQAQLLQAQLASCAAGGQADNWIDLRPLCDGELRQLQWALQQVRSLQRQVRHG